MSKSSTSPVPVPQSTISIEFLNGKRPAVQSVELARHFGLKHKNVLQDIKNLMAKTPGSFNGLNFQPVAYRDEKNEERPCFLLTRDAFTLLVMGWNSARAIEWKLRYIEAFNALERAARENVRMESVALGFRAAFGKTPAWRDRMEKMLHYRRLGLTHKEIAKLMDMGVTTVRHNLAEARGLGLAEGL